MIVARGARVLYVIVSTTISPRYGGGRDDAPGQQELSREQTTVLREKLCELEIVGAKIDDANSVELDFAVHGLSLTGVNGLVIRWRLGLSPHEQVHDQTNTTALDADQASLEGLIGNRYKTKVTLTKDDRGAWHWQDIQMPLVSFTGYQVTDESAELFMN